MEPQGPDPVANREALRKATFAALEQFKAPDPSKPAEDAGKKSGKSKKRKSKGVAARGETALNKFRGTGFEEYYADPPLTLAEHNEEQNIYAREIPFQQRIEECIQRYRARRRLDNERNKLFSQYLMLGGIDATPRQFNGMKGMQDTELPDATTADIRAYGANDVIAQSGFEQYNRFYTEKHADHWEVDFSGVAAGFLSYHMPKIVGYSVAQYMVGIDVVCNFITYVGAHDVCPEYAQDLDRARELCEVATVELPKCSEALSQLPGLFNLACVRLFCKDESGQPDPALAFDVDSKVPEDFNAARVFKAAVAILEELRTTSVFKKIFDLDSYRVTDTAKMSLEITEIIPPTGDAPLLFDTFRTRHGQPLGIPSMGLVKMRPCVIDSGWDNAKPSATELAAAPTEVFVMDTDTMAALEVGFKVTGTVCRIDGGKDLSFLHSVVEVLPSFYTFLPQELMLDFKQPVLNARPAPSVEQPEAEEDQEMEDLGKQFEKGQIGNADEIKPELEVKDMV